MSCKLEARSSTATCLEWQFWRSSKISKLRARSMQGTDMKSLDGWLKDQPQCIKHPTKSAVLSTRLYQRASFAAASRASSNLFWLSILRDITKISTNIKSNMVTASISQFSFTRYQAWEEHSPSLSCGHSRYCLLSSMGDIYSLSMISLTPMGWTPSFKTIASLCRLRRCLSSALCSLILGPPSVRPRSLSPCSPAVLSSYDHL